MHKFEKKINKNENVKKNRKWHCSLYYHMNSWRIFLFGTRLTINSSRWKPFHRGGLKKNRTTQTKQRLVFVWGVRLVFCWRSLVFVEAFACFCWGVLRCFFVPFLWFFLTGSRKDWSLKVPTPTSSKLEASYVYAREEHG